MREERTEDSTDKYSKRLPRRLILLAPILLLSQSSQRKVGLDLQENQRTIDVFNEFMDRAPKQIAESGEFSRIYTEQEFAQLLQDVANHLLKTEQNIVDVAVDTPHVDMHNTNASIDGKAKVKKSLLKKDIEFSCQLSNGQTPNTVQLDSLDYSHKEFIDEIITLAGKKDLLDTLLQDPNLAVVKILNRLYKTRGVAVTKADLSFLNESLAMTMYGNLKASEGSQG